MTNASGTAHRLQSGVPLSIDTSVHSIHIQYYLQLGMKVYRSLSTTFENVQVLKPDSL